MKIKGVLYKCKKFTIELKMLISSLYIIISYRMEMESISSDSSEEEYMIEKGRKK